VSLYEYVYDILVISKLQGMVWAKCSCHIHNGWLYRVKGRIVYHSGGLVLSFKFPCGRSMLGLDAFGRWNFRLLLFSGQGVGAKVPKR
jgi:hypothetical protein